MKQYATIILICTVLLMACKGDYEPYKAGHTDSYVVEYYSYTDIELKPANSRYLDLHVMKETKTYGVLSTDEAGKAMYKAKCEKYNDFGYDMLFYYDDTHMESRFQDRDFASITITSDTDFDAAHPTGTSLNDLFYFSSSSPIAHIRSKYTKTYQWNTASRPEYYRPYREIAHPYLDSVLPIYGLLSDMTPEDFILLGPGGLRWRYTFATFTPVKKPDVDKFHNLTVTLVDTDGNELSATTSFAF